MTLLAFLIILVVLVLIAWFSAKRDFENINTTLNDDRIVLIDRRETVRGNVRIGMGKTFSGSLEELERQISFPTKGKGDITDE